MKDYELAKKSLGEIMRNLPLDFALYGRPREEVLGEFSPQERGLTPEERVQGLSPEEREELAALLAARREQKS